MRVRPLGEALEATRTAAQALADCRRLGASGLPVRSGRRIAGGVEADLLERAVRHGLGDVPVGRLLVAPAPRVAPGTSARKLAAVLAGAAVALVGPARGAGAGFVSRSELPAAPHRGTGRRGTHDPPGLDEARRSRLIGRLPRHLAEVLRTVAAVAARSAGRTWLVGGAVRDLLLARDGADLDLVFESDPHPLAAELASRFAGTLRSSAFLTWTVDCGSRGHVDLARARAEHYAAPAALPEVRPAGIVEDLGRRDFTINALALLVDPANDDRLLDLVGGQRDLAARRLRVLHGLSFVDDPTRAFRAVRFAARLGFRLEPRTASALALARERGAFERLSAARLRREVELLLDVPRGARAIDLATRHGLLEVLTPGLGRKSPLGPLLSRLDRRLAAAPAGEAPRRWIARLGLLVAGTQPERTRPRRGTAAQRPALARAHDALVARLLARLDPPREVRRVLVECARVPALLARLARRPGPPSAVHRVWGTMALETLLVARVLAESRAARRALDRLVERDRHARADVGGHDLLREGVPAGPALARGLAAALAAKLDGRARGPRAQLAVALRAARRARGRRAAAP